MTKAKTPQPVEAPRGHGLAISRPVRKFGKRGAHVTVPVEWLGREVVVQIKRRGK